MATIGTLVVEMRANNAQFEATMQKSSETMGVVGGSASKLERNLVRVGTHGFAHMIPGAEHAAGVIARFGHSLSTISVAGISLGPVLLGLGAAFAAFKVGTFVGEWISLGTSVENYKKKIEEAKKEQDDFIKQIKSEHEVVADLNKQMAQLTGNWEETIRLEKEQRDARIRDVFGPTDNPLKKQALDKSAAIAAEASKKELEKARAEREKFDQDLLAMMEKEREKQFKTWQEETAEFSKQLQLRLKARQDFEAQFGQGGLAGNSATKGIREALDLGGNVQKELRDLAFAKREGFVSETDVVTELQHIRERAIAAGQDIKDKFGGAFPAVDDAVAKALRNVDNLGNEFDQARGFIDRTVPTLDSLTQGVQAFNGMLAAMPPATDAARGAIFALTQEYNQLADALWRVVDAGQQAAGVATQ